MLPLFFAALLFTCGILLAHSVWIRPPLLLLAAILLAITSAVAALRALRVAPLAVACVWFVLGAWCAEMQPQPAPDVQLLAVSDGLTREVEGTITNAAALRHESTVDEKHGVVNTTTQSLDVRLDSVELVDDKEDREVEGSGAIRLNVRWAATDAMRFHCGDRIRAAVRMLPPAQYRDTGVWSRREYLLEQGITSTANAPAEKVEKVGAQESVSFGCVVKEAQRRASERLMELPSRTAALPGMLRISAQDAAMLTAMVSGDRTYLDHSLRVGFERTGSFHMLVVSGFHLAIVAGLVFALTRRLRIPQIPATLLTLVASAAFALFTGFAAPVQRSLFMVSVYMVARLFFRERSALNAIGFAALCLLAADPQSLFGASFQMTMLAVLSIGGIAAPMLSATVQPYLRATRDLRLLAIDAKLEPRLAQFRLLLREFARALRPLVGRWAAWKALPWAVGFALRVVEVLVVSIVIELAMMLPMAVYFHRITLLALPVNVFILPVLLVLLPAALLTLAVLLAWPAAAAVPAAFTAVCLHLAYGLVRTFGELRFGDLRVPMPHTWQMAAFWLLLAAAAGMAYSRTRMLRRFAILALVLAALAPLLPAPVRGAHGALLVEAIDVGQGDSLLIVTPEGKTLLVDAGGFNGPATPAALEFDVGDEVVSPVLWSRGIRRLDVVALSHAHSDHMGGMAAVLKNFQPRELWVGNNPPSAPYEEVLQTAQSTHTALRSFRAGESVELGSTHIRVLAPFADYQPGAEAANNDSLVLRVEYSGSSVLLAGDAEEALEQRMLSESSLQSTLLKVGHHGSISSTSPAFLEHVRPSWAVISCGRRNRFRHPRTKVLQQLQHAGVRTVSTDLNGASCFRLAGGTVETVSCDGAQ